MPVRFRCVYCNQLLGIAKRKAGTVVRCTNCNGQIIVPEAEPVAVGSHSSTRKEAAVGQDNLFERSDLDDLLRPHPLEGSAFSEVFAVQTPTLSQLAPSTVAAGTPVAPRVARWNTAWIVSVVGIISFVAGYAAGRWGP